MPPDGAGAARNNAAMPPAASARPRPLPPQGTAIAHAQPPSRARRAADTSLPETGSAPRRSGRGHPSREGHRHPASPPRAHTLRRARQDQEPGHISSSVGEAPPSSLAARPRRKC
jgi:hypothetical protein